MLVLPSILLAVTCMSPSLAHASEMDEKSKPAFQAAERTHQLRINEIAHQLRQECNMTSRDAKELGSYIDDFEDFDHPETLFAERAWLGGLRMKSGGVEVSDKWWIYYSDRKEPCPGLLRVLKEQIAEQKDFHFPVRGGTARAAQKTFGDFLPEGFKSFVERIRRLSDDEKTKKVDEKMKDCEDRFAKFYADLKARRLDAESVIESGWLPSVLQEALTIYLKMKHLKDTHNDESKDHIGISEITFPSFSGRDGALALFGLWLKFPRSKLEV